MDQTQIQKVEEKPVLQVLTTADLKARIQEETEQRKLITEFISQHLKEGIDYGKIKIKTKDGREVESKPSLFKPGSEKFCSLFHFRPIFARDDETWEMSGKVPGLFTYKCELIAGNGVVVGEGRGAARLSEKIGWTENNAIKIAEKRAQIDAVLRTGGLSDFFTQDLEDMPGSQIEKEIVDTELEPVEKPEMGERTIQIKDPDSPASENQKKAIFFNIKRLGITAEELKEKFVIDDIDTLTKQEASTLISDLNKIKYWEE